MKVLTRICMLKGMCNWSTYMQDMHAQPIFSTLFQVGSLLRCFSRFVVSSVYAISRTHEIIPS